ncbi:MAG: hypothetical protein KDC28_02090 [Saprospiraceae bacterium]|nr:hypothetical protein [Saprospiraceae bacterium]MCB9319973.1 hypothetical protein [Lewinellaceae bacterium]
MVQPNTDPSPAPMPAFPELKDLQFPYAFFYGSPWRTFNHNYKNFQPYTGPTLLVENLNSALVFRPPESQVA